MEIGRDRKMREKVKKVLNTVFDIAFEVFVIYSLLILFMPSLYFTRTAPLLFSPLLLLSAIIVFANRRKKED